jgi:hypothetical protein
VTNRTLAILGLLLLLLGGAAIFPERDRPDGRERVLPGWQGVRPDSLRLDADGRRVTLRRSAGDAWSRADGGVDPDVSRRVEALAHGLLDLDRGVVVARDLPVGELARYGLETPHAEVASWSDVRAAHLALGDPSPLPGEVYACVRDGKAERVDVFLLPQGLSRAVTEIARDSAR